MQTLAFCRQNGLVRQNHGLRIRSDKLCADSTTKNTQKNLKTYLADLLGDI